MCFFKAIIIVKFFSFSIFAQELLEVKRNGELTKDLPVSWTKDASGDEVLILDYKIRIGLEKLRVLKASMSGAAKAGNIEKSKTLGYQKVMKSDYENYTVLRGETIQAISKKLYGTSERWKDLYLLNENQMKDGGVKEGMRLKYRP